MYKEHKIELSLKEMDMIIDSLKHYPTWCDTYENNMKLTILGKLMYKESKIYEKEANAPKQSN